ncbi:MAG: heavy-metal-associated domain-containing protein [Sandaracinaceae bacterium]
MAHIELTIEGMSCGHCVKAVEDALSHTPGVTAVEVSLGHARVEGDVERAALVAAIEEEDFRVVTSGGGVTGSG